MPSDLSIHAKVQTDVGDQIIIIIIIAIVFSLGESSPYTSGDKTK